MKSFFVALILISSHLVSANSTKSVFRSKTSLPPVLQKRILVALEKKCGSALRSGSLTEVSTAVVSEQIDQGIQFLHFNTELSLSIMFAEHPVSYRILVQSTESAIDNPAFDRYDIQSIWNEGDICH
jgi:hypothetical protein